MDGLAAGAVVVGAVVVVAVVVDALVVAVVVAVAVGVWVLVITSVTCDPLASLVAWIGACETTSPLDVEVCWKITFGCRPS